MKRILFFFVFLLYSLLSLADQNVSYPFSIESEREGDGHRIVAHNNGPAPISVKISIIDGQNIYPDRPFPVYAVVPPGGGTLYLARIRPATAGVGYSFKTQSSWLLGDFNSLQSPDALYRLPFRDGMAFRIGQAPGGPITTHITPDSQYAVDIQMPQDAPVLAARDGVVIYTEANQIYGGQSPDMMSKANEVRLQHVDGTIAIYAHLAHGGVYVYPGQRVTAGTQIGLTGTTGYSSGPHLHFAVQTVTRSGDALAMVSLPFQFYVGNPSTAFSPKFGMLALADYSSSAKVPGTEVAVLVTEKVMPTGQATDSPQMPIYFDVPAPVRSWLANVPMWKWLGVIAPVALLLILLGYKVKTRQREESRVTQEPSIWPVEERSHYGLSTRDKLTAACWGDKQRVDRLMAYERQRSPHISIEEAAERAWDRLQRDRH